MPNGTFADAVINPASTEAYLTAPGMNEVFPLNLTTLRYGRPIPVGSVPQGIDITPDGKTLYVCDSGGPFDVYRAATGRVVAGSLNDFITSSSLDGNGSAMLVSGDQATYVIDPATGTLLGSIACANGNSVLNASRSAGYCVLAQSVVKLRVSRFLTGATISLPEPTTPGALPALSPNGRFLVIESNGGATVVKF